MNPQVTLKMNLVAVMVMKRDLGGNNNIFLNSDLTLFALFCFAYMQFSLTAQNIIHNYRKTFLCSFL